MSISRRERCILAPLNCNPRRRADSGRIAATIMQVDVRHCPCGECRGRCGRARPAASLLSALGRWLAHLSNKARIARLSQLAVRVPPATQSRQEPV